MVNQEEKLKDTELFYEDIKIDYTNLEKKSREMEKTNVEVNEEIKKLEIENQDLNERLNSFSDLYQNEYEESNTIIIEKDKQIEQLQSQLANLEETVEDFYKEHTSKLEELKILEDINQELKEEANNARIDLEKSENNKNNVKDRSSEYNSKIGMAENKIVELQGLNMG